MMGSKIRIGREYRFNKKTYRLSSWDEKNGKYYLVNNLCGEIIIDEKEFADNFIPCKIEIGDEVIAVSMGKTVGYFVAIEVNDTVAHFSGCWNERRVLTLGVEIPDNGIFKPIVQPANLSTINGVDYIFVTNSLDKRVKSIQALGRLNTEIEKLSRDVQFVVYNKLGVNIEREIEQAISIIKEIRQKINHGRE